MDLTVYLKPRVLVVLLLGFSFGIPAHLDRLDTPGMDERPATSDLRNPSGCSLRSDCPTRSSFLWAPFIDALDVAIALSGFLGRRRGWLLLSQLILMAAIGIAGIPAIQPSRLGWVAGRRSAGLHGNPRQQDIVVDAFRVESLPEEGNQAAGMASYVRRLSHRHACAPARAHFFPCPRDLCSLGMDVHAGMDCMLHCDGISCCLSAFIAHFCWRSSPRKSTVAAAEARGTRKLNSP